MRPCEPQPHTQTEPHISEPMRPRRALARSSYGCIEPRLVRCGTEPHEVKRSTSHATCIHPFSLTQPYTCLLRAHVTPAPLGSLPPGPPHYHQPTKSVQSSNATCAEVAAVRCAIHAHAASARALAHIRQSASMCPPCMSTCISTAMSRSPLSMSRRPLGKPCASPRSSSLACSSLADGSP